MGVKLTFTNPSDPRVNTEEARAWLRAVEAIVNAQFERKTTELLAFGATASPADDVYGKSLSPTETIMCELSDRVAKGMKKLLAEPNELLTGGVILPAEPPTTEIKAFLEPTAKAKTDAR